MGSLQHLLRPRSERVVQDAGFLRRAFAFAVDILMIDLFITVPFAPVFARLVHQVETQGMFSLTYTSSELGAIIALFLVVYAYFVVFEYTLGQTIGQMLLSISVRSDRLWRFMVRNAFLLPFFPFVLLWIIEPIMILASKRGVMERLSQTRTLYQQHIIL